MAGTLTNLASSAAARSPILSALTGAASNPIAAAAQQAGGAAGAQPPVQGQAATKYVDPQVVNVSQGAPAQGGQPQGGIPALIQQYAQKYNVDPAIAIKVARSEGGLSNPVQQSGVFKTVNGVRRQEPSYGPFQLLVGGGDTGFPEGMGNQMIRETGLDPRDPKNLEASIDFAMKQASQKGWGQWYGARAVGVGDFDGINRKPGATAVASAQPSTLDRVLGTNVATAPQGAPPASASAPAAPTQPQSTLDRVLAAVGQSKPMQPVQAADPTVAAPVNLGAQEIAATKQKLLEQAAQPNQGALARKQALSQRLRGTAKV